MLFSLILGAFGYYILNNYENKKDSFLNDDPALTESFGINSIIDANSMIGWGGNYENVVNPNGLTSVDYHFADKNLLLNKNFVDNLRQKNEQSEKTEPFLLQDYFVGNSSVKNSYNVISKFY